MLGTIGLFSKIYQRIETMERNITQKMLVLERKVDMKNLQQLKVQSVTPANANQPAK
jgi:hypothetical protein